MKIEKNKYFKMSLIFKKKVGTYNRWISYLETIIKDQ